MPSNTPSERPSHRLAEPETLPVLLLARTDGRTNGRPTHLPETRLVGNRAGENEKWVIRRKRFPCTSEWAWRVSHSSLPQGRPLYGSVHLDRWEDALEYALDKAAGLAS